MTILWFGIYKNNFGRNKIYIEALRAAGHVVLECQDSSPGLLKYARLWQKHRALRGKYDVLVVGYPGHLVTPLARLISGKKIVVDALGSLYDAEVNSHYPTLWKKIKSRLVDWLMVRCAHSIILESQAQKDYFSDVFGPSPKYHVVYTGASSVFDHVQTQPTSPTFFNVVFRGKLTPECGIMYILKAAEMLKGNTGIRFSIIGSGYFLEEVTRYINEQALSNIELISKYLTDEELVMRVHGADLMLGQFEDNPRLNRTIPHKAFEAFAANRAYITGTAPAIQEIVHDGVEVFLTPCADAELLASKIEDLSRNRTLVATVAAAAHRKYDTDFTGKVLAQKLVEVML